MSKATNLGQGKSARLSAAGEEAADRADSSALKHVADRCSGGYLRPRKDALLLQEDGHDIIGREELESLMTSPESRCPNEDRHRPGSTGEAVIPLDAKVAYDIQQGGCRRTCGERFGRRRSLIAPLGHRSERYGSTSPRLIA
jgi:hypothetical protein